MGPIKIGTQVITEEAEIVTNKKAIDPETDEELTVNVERHEKGGRAWIEVSNGITSETRMPKPGTKIYINGVGVEHER